MDYLARQRPIPAVAYQGVPGGYGEQAALEHFGTAQWKACETFGAVVRAVQAGEADYGVLPLENSVTGPVVQPMDLLAASGLSIVGERSLPIRHCLVGVAGAQEEEIRQVVSHEQGLAQCSQYLESHPAMEVSARRNTAEAARMWPKRVIRPVRPWLPAGQPGFMAFPSSGGIFRTTGGIRRVL